MGENPCSGLVGDNVAPSGPVAREYGNSVQQRRTAQVNRPNQTVPVVYQRLAPVTRAFLVSAVRYRRPADVCRCTVLSTPRSFLLVLRYPSDGAQWET